MRVQVPGVRAAARSAFRVTSAAWRAAGVTSRAWRAAGVACAVLLLAAHALAATAPAARLKVTKLKFIVGHRVFTDFHDVVTTGMRESFRVGDSEYSAKVVEFQPDFTMDLKTHKVTSRSQEPRNPAARIVVWKSGAPNDTAWAFLNMPPHFARHSMLAFRLARVEFENHAPVDAPVDTTARVRAGATR
jgi:hypothetical protein